MSNDVSLTTRRSLLLMPALRTFAETEMPKRFAFLCAIPLFLGTGAFAQSTTPAATTTERTFWDHNGSVMYLVANDLSREFYYQKPRPGMLDAGAHPDSLLFRGQITDGHFSGIAFLFNANCGQVPFAVKGPILDNGERVVLTGQAPHVGRNCHASGEYTSTLEFKLLKTVAQPDQTPATAQTPNIENSKPGLSSTDAGEPKLPSAQSAPSTLPPNVEQPKPDVPSSAVGEPKLPVPPSAETPLTARTLGNETTKPKLHQSEPNKAITPSTQASVPTSGPTVAQSLMDKNILAPVIIALNVALPFLSILFLIWVLRSNETPPITRMSRTDVPPRGPLNGPPSRLQRVNRLSSGTGIESS
jgi:hypothetical protein